MRQKPTRNEKATASCIRTNQSFNQSINGAGFLRETINHKRGTAVALKTKSYKTQTNMPQRNTSLLYQSKTNKLHVSLLYVYNHQKQKQKSTPLHWHYKYRSHAFDKTNHCQSFVRLICKQTPSGVVISINSRRPGGGLLGERTITFPTPGTTRPRPPLFGAARSDWLIVVCAAMGQPCLRHDYFTDAFATAKKQKNREIAREREIPSTPLPHHIPSLLKSVVKYND